MRKRFPKVKGADNAMAQGQAIINTAVNTFMALLTSVISQNVVETTAMVKIAIVKCLLTSKKQKTTNYETKKL